MSEFTLEHLVQGASGRLRVQDAAQKESLLALPLGKVVTHSGEVTRGDVFWALVGERHDGADFAAEAISRGAAGIVARSGSVVPPPGGWVVEVDDPQSALWRLARWQRARLSARVIAVTGSAGKTTTRQMIAAALSGVLRGTASPRNFNNHVGLPLSLLSASPQDDFAVFELGASAAGEIGRLAALCRPDIAVIASAGDAHLQGFGSREAIAAAKAEILEALPEDGWAVLAGDDPQLRRAAAGHGRRTIWFGRSADCDACPEHVAHHDGLLSFVLDGSRFEVPVWGRHHLGAALAAVAVARIFELDDDEIAAGLRQFRPLRGRCSVVRRNDVTVIDDSYNASPAAMQAALDLLGQFPTTGKRIAVCGEMAELGDAAGALHRTAGRDVVRRAAADVMVSCGEHRDEYARGARDAGMPGDSVLKFESSGDVAAAIEGVVAPGDVVLVKGSRAGRMEQVVTALSGKAPAGSAPLRTATMTPASMQVT